MWTDLLVLTGRAAGLVVGVCGLAWCVGQLGG